MWLKHIKDMYDSIVMKNFGIILTFLFLNGCLQHTALLGPALTVANSGNIYQAGLSYGSNKAITKITKV